MASGSSMEWTDGQHRPLWKQRLPRKQNGLPPRLYVGIPIIRSSNTDCAIAAGAVSFTIADEAYNIALRIAYGNGELVPIRYYVIC